MHKIHRMASSLIAVPFSEYFSSNSYRVIRNGKILGHLFSRSHILSLKFFVLFCFWMIIFFFSNHLGKVSVNIPCADTAEKHLQSGWENKITAHCHRFIHRSRRRTHIHNDIIKIMEFSHFCKTNSQRPI